MTRRLAVVLMNLGGPDTLEAVRPFLKNLFSDPAIINLPRPLRPLIAEIISRRRNQSAQKIYQKLGGGSPLFENTKAQQRELSKLLQLPGQTVEVFIAMRYWHPLTAQTVSDVKKFQPTEVVLLPLYPQFSITTTGSSFAEWHAEAAQQGLKVPTREVRSYPQNSDFIEAHVDLLLPWIEKAAAFGSPRILFSAHGLPQKVIDKGDPYETHVHQTVGEILKKIPSYVESVVCYQSKVGPLKWLEPSIEQELRRAGKDAVPVIVVPVAFVSEHSETLVELDEDYRNLAQELKIPFYGRVPTLSDHPAYMRALAGLVVEAK
jgi:protoporphyrin/coproporphyrin ferrochelatase